MNGKQVANKIGITYPQLRYFTRRIDTLSKKETSQGHDHDFNYRDLVFLRLAALMRADGIGLWEINYAIKVINANWTNTESPADGGVLIRRADDLYPWTWSADIKLVYRGNEANGPVNYLKHVSGFFYNVGVIATELAKDDQLELDIMTDKMAVT